MDQHSHYFLLRSLTNWQPLRIEVTVPPPPAGSIADLGEVPALAVTADTVSFDVFDTLLRRDVEPPQAVVSLLAQWLRAQLLHQGHEIRLEALVALRADAEGLARQEQLDQGLDAECRLSQIVGHWLELLRRQLPVGCVLPALEDLVEREVQLELGRLSAMPQARASLQALRDAGKRIVAISDMYLERQHLQRILEAHGLAQFLDAIHVSSQYGLSKGSGRLFAHLLQTGQISPDTLHIGDHPLTDLERARGAGLQARLLHSQPELKRRRRIELAARAWTSFGDAGELWPGTRRPAEPIARIGYDRLGPVLALFGAAVVEQCLLGGYSQVDFLARDGFLLRQLYERLAAGLDVTRELALPPARYLYLSRASTRFAALDNLREELASLSQRVNREQGVWALLSTLGLDHADYRPLIESLLGTLDASPSLERSAAQIGLLLNAPEFMAQVQVDLERKRRDLSDYLVQQGLLDAGPGRQLIVDIGWNGSILTSLEQAFGARLPELDALMFGRLYGSEIRGIQVLPGFAFDQLRSQPIEHLVNQCRELFEVASAAPEGSVVDYRREQGGAVVPVLAEIDADGGDARAIRALQDGILCWCDDFVAFSNRFGFAPERFRAHALLEATSLIAGRYPEELDILAPLQFDLGWGTGSKVSLREYLGIGARPAGPSPAIDSAQLRLSLDDGQDAASASAHPQKLLEKIHRFVEALRLEGELAIYGVGTVASLVAPLVQDRIRYFVDGNASLHGKDFLGRPVRAPDTAIQDATVTLVVTPIGRKRVISARLQGRQGRTLYIDDYL